LIQTIIFDWFGVVCNKAFLEWARDNAPDPRSFDVMLQLADPLDAGEITLQQFLSIIGAMVGQSATVVRSGIETRIQINANVLALIRRIKAHRRVAVLSNVNAEFLAQVLRTYKLEPLFDHVIASSALRLAKPDPQIFELALQILGCEVAQVVFIDDTAEHVEAARGLGIEAIHFESAQQLEASLVQLGILEGRGSTRR
jgi:putative hydrolase of the HAD superfamily